MGGSKGVFAKMYDLICFLVPFLTFGTVNIGPEIENTWTDIILTALFIGLWALLVVLTVKAWKFLFS